MRPYLTGTPMLTNGSGSSGMPDKPYQCPQCAKSFRHLSQLMQHQDQKHGNLRMLGLQPREEWDRRQRGY